MELERARSLLEAERARVQRLLADLGTSQTDDHVAERDASDPAQPLAEQGVDDAVAAGPSRMNAWRLTRRPSSPSRRPPRINRRIDKQAAS